MAKYLVLDEKAKRDLNRMCRTLGYNFPLGDWLNQFNDVLAKLDSDTGVADIDYESTHKTD